jgi:hypothetical protein
LNRNAEKPLFLARRKTEVPALTGYLGNELEILKGLLFLLAKLADCAFHC